MCLVIHRGFFALEFQFAYDFLLETISSTKSPSNFRIAALGVFGKESILGLQNLFLPKLALLLYVTQYHLEKCDMQQN